jgi:hypothetical protein
MCYEGSQLLDEKDLRVARPMRIDKRKIPQAPIMVGTADQKSLTYSREECLVSI